MAETTEDGGVPYRERACCAAKDRLGGAQVVHCERFSWHGRGPDRQESGIAVGQIYRDFSSKEAIVAEIVQADCMDFLAPESLCAGIKSGDPEFVWKWLADFVRPEADEADPLFAEIVAETARNDRIKAIFEGTREEVRSTMMIALSALIPGDAFAERRLALVDVITATALGLMQHRFLSPVEDTDRAATLMLGMLRREVADMQAEAAKG
jgi:AcrR family transcriptional regulator